MKEASTPFRKIIVAYDDSPAAREALDAGIELCRLVGTSLETITVIEPPSVYSGLVIAIAPEAARDLETGRERRCREMMEFAVAEGRRHGIGVTGHVLEAGEVDGVISFPRAQEADLLVIGLRQHNSDVARLWSTVSRLEQDAPCTFLAIRPLAQRAADEYVADRDQNQMEARA